MDGQLKRHFNGLGLIVLMRNSLIIHCPNIIF